MDQCCSNVENIFVLYLQSVTCRNLPCTVLKVIGCLKLNRASFPNLLVRGSLGTDGRIILEWILNRM
jgi:hypothetical protein